MLLGTYDGTYYNAAMGLFGYVYGGTVKNLTIDNFYSEGEFTPTGCVAAYAANATFENIAITSSHPQTYNTSVAAVVGRDGSNGANNNGGYNLIFKNITVDDTNTVSALWGSWDVGAAGLLGYLGSDSKVLFENCNVAATIDVYNDVCGNYQYYWYRYCGAYIGTVDKRLDNGKGALDLSNVTAKKCTVNFGDRHEYYYCEFEKNSIASYTDDFQFSRVDHSELNIDANPVTCKHVHTANEDKQAVYIPFRQLFGGYGWGVDGVDEYENIEISDYTNAQDKFETKFTGNFLYRVGNQNAVSIDSLFAAKDNMEINASGVYVTIDKVDENMNVSGSFTANTTDWTKGTIQLEGTGVVKVTIQDYNFCKPTELYLEVVDAKNITSANGSNGINVVLLQNIKVSANGTINYQSCTVYGNGFEIDVRGGMNQYNSKQGHGIIIAKNATLDHLSIVGDIYDEYGMYTTTLTGAAQNDYTAAVDAEHCIIQNCYIANCAAPVRSNGNTIIDTTLYGGTIANLLISGGSNTLTNVTTVNYNDGRGVVGMGIVITDGASADSTKLILNGYLKQYNFVYETDISAIKVTEAQTVFNSMFDNQFSAYHIGSNPKAVNTGIISINESINLDDAVLVDSANTGYLVSNDVTVTFYAQGFEKNVGAAVASVPAANNSVDNNYEKVAYSQGDYLPTFEFDLGDQMQAKDNDDDTRFLIGDKNGLSAMYPKGESALLLNLNTLAKWSKYTGISYTVTAKCITPSGEERTGTVTLDTKGTYTLVFTVKDDIFYNQNGQKINKSVTRTYEVPLVLDVYEKSIADATISIDSAGLTGEWGGYSGNWKYTMYPLDAIEQIMDDANKDGVAEPFDHKTNIESVVLDPASNNAFSAATTVTITYNNGQVLELVLGVPSGCSSPGASNGGKTLSASIDSNHGIKIVSDGKIANKCNGTWPITSWRFKGTSQKVVANSTTVTITFSAESSSGGGNTTCLAEGTLITLADGTKKAIEDLRKGDSVMAFDHLTGKVTNNDIIIVVKTQSDFYKNTFIFDDGSELVTINEHGIFDLDLNKYVNIDAVNYKQFIGHRFVAIGTTGKVGVKKLIDVTVEWTTGYKYDIVTNQTLNYVAEDTLSVTHVLVDVINTFDFGEDLKYSTTKMQSDIEKYGLYNYNEWDEYCDISVFEQYNIPVMKVGISKGLYTKEYIIGLINKYVLDDSVQIVG